MSKPHSECGWNPFFLNKYFNEFSVKRWVCEPPKCLLKILGKTLSITAVKEKRGTTRYIIFIFLLFFKVFINFDNWLMCSKTPINVMQLKLLDLLINFREFSKDKHLSLENEFF